MPINKKEKRKKNWLKRGEIWLGKYIRSSYYIEIDLIRRPYIYYQIYFISLYQIILIFSHESRIASKKTTFSDSVGNPDCYW